MREINVADVRVGRYKIAACIINVWGYMEILLPLVICGKRINPFQMNIQSTIYTEVRLIL